MRLALAVGLATYVALATGEVPALDGAFCTQRCPDDDSKGNCAPDCSDCLCCSHVRLSIAVPEVKVPMPAEFMRVPEQQQLVPQSPEPGDILHVPKTLVA